MIEAWKNSYMSATIMAAFPTIITFILLSVSSNLPSHKFLVKSMLSFAAVVSILIAAFIALFGPYYLMMEANNIVISETKYTIVAASETEDSNQLDLTIKDANGKTTTITTGISNFEIAEQGDFFIVTEYETHTKSYTIVYEEESEYADVFDAFRMRQEIVK